MKVITQDSIATIGFGQILWGGRGEQGADALKLPTIFYLQVISSRDNPPLLDQLMDLDGWECNNLLRFVAQPDHSFTRVDDLPGLPIPDDSAARIDLHFSLLARWNDQLFTVPPGRRLIVEDARTFRFGENAGGQIDIETVGHQQNVDQVRSQSILRGKGQQIRERNAGMRGDQ
jgi:hypothetical protein